MTWHRVGHRGAPQEFPANTLRSFQRAVELGCTMVECDVRLSADGVPVLAHDAEVEDVHGDSCAIAEHDSRFLRALDLGAGEGVPTLEELVAWAQGRCAVMADMKCEGDGVEAKVAAALAPLPPEAKLIPGAGAASRQRFREIDPTLPLSLSLSVRENRLPDEAAFAALLPAIETEAVTWEYPLLTPARVAALRERGLRVFAWTVDDLPTMRRLRACGVDGLISNRPDLLAGISW